MEINIIPDWVLAKLRVPQHLRAHVGVWVSALLVVVFVPLLRLVPHICLSRELFGVPCPGCGITTALRALEQAQFRSSWTANPAGIAIAAVVLFQLIARPVALLSERSATVVSSVSARISFAALAALFVIWGVRIVQIIS